MLQYRSAGHHRGYCVTPTVITPSGLGAMEAGLVLDEEGQRFVVDIQRTERRAHIGHLYGSHLPELCRAPCPDGEGSQRGSQLGYSWLTAIANLDNGFVRLS
jgi:hypothetical protein